MTDHWLPATDTAKYSPPDQLFLLERAPACASAITSSVIPSGSSVPV